MKDDSMLDAIRNQKAKAINLTIFIGGPDEMDQDGVDVQGDGVAVQGMSPELAANDDPKEEQKELGLAPAAEPLEDNPAHPDEAQDKALIDSEIAKSPLLGPKSIARKKGKV